MEIDDESSHTELCSELAGGVTRNIVCLFREPDAVTPPVRFDEGEQEKEQARPGGAGEPKAQPKRHREAKATAPVLDSISQPGPHLSPAATHMPGSERPN